MLPKKSVSNISPPNSKDLPRVRNPFEVALTERLQQHTIGSPNLFHIPPTPQLSSTQFEWTIDEVSSLQPADVELNETQFQNTPDPELEEKAQSIISSFFKEQLQVPSPVNCPLRRKRIILAELNANTPITKSTKRNRDMGTQTDLSFPLVLPKAVMDFLQQYVNISVTEQSCNISDVSLRRKLFDIHNIVVLDNDESITSTTWLEHNGDSMGKKQCTTIAGKLSDSVERSFCGSLSPISSMEGVYNSFQSDIGKPTETGCIKESMQTFVENLQNEENLSPIKPTISFDGSARKRKSTTQYEVMDESMSSQLHHSNANSFMPNRSSSPMRCSDAHFNQSSSSNMSVSYKMTELCGSKSKKVEKAMSMPHDGNLLDNNLETNVDRCSYDFDAQPFEADDGTIKQQKQFEAYKALEVAQIRAYATPQKEPETVRIFGFDNNTEPTKKQTAEKQANVFQRVDSGFNDMSSSCSNGQTATHHDDSSESMQF